MSKIKQLQNNFTTPEQSKRLLELGVPTESADCYYHHYFTNDPTPICCILQPQWDETIGSIRGKTGQLIIPCWSVGRLIEIMDICQEYCFQFDGDYDEWIPYNHCNTEDLLRILTDKRNKFDFSKIED